MDERKSLLVGGNLLEAHTWKGLLEACGIEVELRGEALLGAMGALAAHTQHVELWVSELQYDRAQQQLIMLEGASPSWQCLQCSEVNAASFELCWQCGAERYERHNN